jgi:mono/diheme cytochrome c family protein
MRKLSTSQFKYLISIPFLSILACSSNVNTHSGNLDTIDSAKKEVYLLSSLDSVDGKKLYDMKCLVCHQADGKGIPGLFPPLAGSDYFALDKKRAVKIIMHGCKDSVVVNGTIYKKHQMPEIGLTDQEFMTVSNYILNSWGNVGGQISIGDVNASK